MSAADPNTLIAHPAPAGATLSGDFAVAVRQPGGPWRDLAVHPVRVDLHTLSQASFAAFDCAGPVEIKVTSNTADITSAEVRPRSYAITPHSSGRVATFTLDRPRNLSFEINGDRLHNLHIFANPLETDVPRPDAPGVIWFGPGIHRLGNHPAITSAGSVGGKAKAVVKVPSGATVYLAGGAILEAAIVLEKGASDVTIRGRGIIDLSPWNEPDGHYHQATTWQTGAITLPNAQRVRIEGVIVRQPTGYSVSAGNASQVMIENLKAFSSHEWSDGIDMMSSSGITVRGVFMRNSDDTIAVYGTRFSYHGDSRDWLVEDSVLWADKAHAIYIGVHGDYQGTGDTIEGLVFRNLDILENDEASDGFWGALSIGCGDRNTCRRILFDGIRVEHIREAGGRLVDLQFKHYQPSTVDGTAISDITFRNLSYDGLHGSLIAGKSDHQVITGVTFENLRLGGRLAMSAAEGRVTVGPHASGVRFIATP